MNIFICKPGCSCMTSRTRLNQCVMQNNFRRKQSSFRIVRCPPHWFCCKPDSKTFIIIIAALVFGPLKMPRCGTMTGLTGNIIFIPCTMKRIGKGIEVFFVIGCVTVGAHVIPVLVNAHPEKFITCQYFFVSVNMKPSLSSLFFWSCVPAKRQGLYSTVLKSHQILL